MVATTSLDLGAACSGELILVMGGYRISAYLWLMLTGKEPNKDAHANTYRMKLPPLSVKLSLVKLPPLAMLIQHQMHFRR